MQRTSVSRRWASIAGSVAVLAALGVTQVAADLRAPAAPTPDLPGAAVENVASQTPTVSADGRFVAYAGSPAPSADEAAPDARTSTIWLKDREASTVVELTTVAPDVPAGDSKWPVVSADGCTVTVITEMGYDLFRDDDGGTRWDVYRLLLPHCGGTPGDWELVSASRGVGTGTAAGDDVSPLYPPAVSGEGNFVAYTHSFSVVAPELTGITLVDLTVAIGDTGRSLPVAGTPAAAPDSTFLYRGLREPSLSADGSVVAFTSDSNAASALADWGTGPEPGDYATSNVYVWDRSNLDRNTNVRRLSAAGNDPGDSYDPVVSGNGRFVAFVSRATSLVAGATLPQCNPRCTSQVYLFDRNDGSLRLASRQPGDPTSAPVGADSDASQPALDHSGDELLYVTRASNLFPTRSSAAGGPGDGDVVLFVPSTGLVDRVSVLADGVTPAPAANSHPQLSATGRVVVFDTLAGPAYGNPAVVGRQVAIVAHTPVLEMADLDVGTVAVGFPGPEWFLVVSNHGPSSFSPALVEVSNPDFLISGGSCADVAAAAVAPGGTCTLHLMMMPTLPGEVEGTVTISEEGFDAVSITAELSGFGGDPTLAATAPTGGYGGSLVVGQRGEPVSFTLLNVAFNPVKVSKITVEGSNPDDFEISLDECTRKTLDAATECNLQVIFTPTAAGRRTANIVAVTDGDMYATILVSGDAHYEPKIAVDSTTVFTGAQLTVAGAGFAPNTAVAIGWADGSGATVTVVTDEAGGLVAMLPVRPNERAGNRVVVAQTTDGQVASTDVLVVPKAKNHGPGSATWPGR
ncbi:MAG: choice-of-anchor D domain-containing protein [Actinomycetota bacterium]|nr:choice-of-anchor D domain-containing protein [Actinomycetota bacterium]